MSVARLASLVMPTLNECASSAVMMTSYNKRKSSLAEAFAKEVLANTSLQAEPFVLLSLRKTAGVALLEATEAR